MRTYIAKIITSSGKLSLQFAKIHYSDSTAIRAAQELGGSDGDTIEVWRDDVCIYSGRPKPIRLVWPVCSNGPSGKAQSQERPPL